MRFLNFTEKDKSTKLKREYSRVPFRLARKSHHRQCRDLRNSRTALERQRVFRHAYCLSQAPRRTTGQKLINGRSHRQGRAVIGLLALG
jgi:hypothetical protein